MFKLFRNAIIVLLYAHSLMLFSFFLDNQVRAKANNLNSNSASIEQTVKTSASIWKEIAEGRISSKQRTKINRLAVREYLRDYISPNDKDPEQIKRFNDMIKEVETKISDIAPHIALIALSDSGKVKASIQLSINKIQSLLIKYKFPTTGNTNNIANSSQIITKSNNNLAKLNSVNQNANGNDEKKTYREGSLPFVTLTLDEKNWDVYVWPPETLAKFIVAKPNLKNTGYNFKPSANINRTGINDLELNSQVSPLEQRSALFSVKTMGYLEGQNLEPDPEWGVQILQFLVTSAAVKHEHPWPLALPWSMSTLQSNPGVVGVFTFRSADQTGILEKLDFIGHVRGRLIRQYWSRGLNDPGYFESSAKALERIGASFSRLHRAKIPSAKKATIEFKLDKSISERDLAKLESNLRKFALGEENILIPTYVGKGGIKYQSAIPLAKSTEVFRLVQSVFPSLSITMRTKNDPPEQKDAFPQDSNQSNEEEAFPETMIVINSKLN